MAFFCCPEPRYFKPREIEVTLTVSVQPLRHYCVSDEYAEAEDVQPILLQETLRFNLDILFDYPWAHAIIAGMLRRMGFYEHFDAFNHRIDDIIRCGLRAAALPINLGRRIVPLQVEITEARVVQHVVPYVSDEGESEEDDEFETGNHGMVPATESSINQMLRRLRIDDHQSSGERTVEDNCAICLEELSFGSEISQMPCSHSFHCHCIEEWLRQSHYCPICRFEMPIS